MPSINGVVFFANKIYQNFTKSSAPTWEDEDGVLGGAAVDSLGDAVAATEVAFDILDTQRLTRIAVDSDDTHNTGNDDDATWRFDVDLNSLQDIDFAIMDNHDVRNAYDQEIKANIDVYHDANATFNGSTVLTPTKHFSGLIGKGRPYLEFDGDNDNAAIADSVQMEVGTGDFAVEIIFRLTPVGVTSRLWTSASYGISGYVSSSNKFTIEHEGVGETTLTADTTLAADTTYFYTVTRSAGVVTFYLNAVSDGSEAWAKDLTADINYIGYTSNTLHGTMELLRFGNRNLSSAEVTTRYAGWTHTPIPAADQWGAQVDLMDAGDAWTGATGATPPDGWSVTGGFVGTHTIIDQSGSGAPDTANLSLAKNVDSNPFITEIETVVIGKKYQVSYWAANPDATGHKLNLGTTLTGTEYYTSGIIATAAWTKYYTDVFTATSTSLHITLQTLATAGTPQTMWDQVKLYQVGCVAEYHPDGINPGETKWYDSSSNNLDGTISGATEKDCPTAVNGKGDFTLYEFTEVLKRYWFWQINLDNNTADTNTSTGQIGLGKKFNVALEPDLPVGENHLYDGIYLSESQGGRRSSNERYGRRLRWELNWSYIPESEKANFETFLETVKGKMYPFWFTLNYNDNEPIFYWGRLINNPKFTPQADGIYSVNLIIEEEI